MNRPLWPTLALVALLACRSEPPPTASSAPTSKAAGAAQCAAQDDLSRIDPRKPLPLLPHMANHQKQNMRDHLMAVSEVVTALSSGDFAAVEGSARRLGTSERMAAMCSHMGTGAPGFTEQAMNFHRTADQIAEAARQHDRDAVERALSATLATCTGCHATWKQQVVDEAPCGGF